MVSDNYLWRRIRAWVGMTIVALTITLALHYISPFFAKKEPISQPIEKIVEIQPLPGHWLKTEESGYADETLKVPAAQEETLPEQALEDAIIPVDPAPNNPQSFEGDLKAKANNSKLKNTNVSFYWTDGPLLKAVTLMSINNESKRGGVVALPLFTKVNYKGKSTTLGEVFKAGGREDVDKLVAEYMDITIGSFVEIDQRAFIKISDIVGPIDIKGEIIPVADAFEQTRTGQRKEDQEVVRAVARSILRPEMLVKLPKILWVLSQEVSTNLGSQEILAIYRMTRNTDVEAMRKVALPGETYYVKGKKYRDVPEETWKNILWELTASQVR